MAYDFKNIISEDEAFRYNKNSNTGRQITRVRGILLYLVLARWDKKSPWILNRSCAVWFEIFSMCTSFEVLPESLSKRKINLLFLYPDVLLCPMTLNTPD